MKTFIQQFWSGIALLLMLTLTGCAPVPADQQNNTNDNVVTQQSSLRMMNVGDRNTTLTFKVDGEAQGDVTYGRASGYLKLSPGSHTVTVFEKGQANPVMDTTVTVEPETQHTWFVFRSNGSYRGSFTTDKPAALKSENVAMVRVVMASSTNAAFDIYQNSGDMTKVTGRTQKFANLTYRDISGYAKFPVGTATLQLTEAGKTDVVATLTTEPLKNQRQYTIVLEGQVNSTADKTLQARIFTDNNEGTLNAVVNATIVDDIKNAPKPMAYLRVSNFTTTLKDNVEVRLDGNVFIDTVAQGQTSGFVKVEAGTHKVAVQNKSTGQVLLEKSITLAQNDKQDMFVSEASGELEVLTGLLQMHATPDKSRLRIVNQVKGATSLTADLERNSILNLFGDIKANAVTSYREVNAGSIPMTFSAVGSATYTADFAPMTLNANKTYTLVLSGDWTGRAKGDLKAYVLADDGEGDIQQTLTMTERSRVTPMLLTMAMQNQGRIQVFVDNERRTDLTAQQPARMETFTEGRHTLMLKKASDGSILWEGEFDVTSRMPHTMVLYERGNTLKAWSFVNKDEETTQPDKASLRVLQVSSLSSALQIQLKDGTQWFEGLQPETSTGFQTVAAGSWNLSLRMLGQNLLPALAEIDVELMAQQRYTLLIADKLEAKGTNVQAVKFMLVPHP
ncbi:MAG: DUF4397 domain-containing protein [Deltaproteobacteria bacterium]|nr:MAG: DUF4397 domain-containing protein [Deltaproteobacteria bacterium]